jgi:hypothetical protein
LFNDGELQRLDLGAYSTEVEQSGEPVFSSDKAALDFVKKQAKEGSLYHAKALEIYQAVFNGLDQVKPIPSIGI